jgi:hypothetical protein
MEQETVDGAGNRGGRKKPRMEQETVEGERNPGWSRKPWREQGVSTP